MKKAISVLLCLCLALSVFTALPFTASAAEVTEESVGASSGTTGNCTWTLVNDGLLTISGNGYMGNYSYTYSNGTTITTAPWGANIKTVVIEDGVKSIGEKAFYGCKNLTSVTIGNSVTSIGRFAFYYCTGLTSVTIPDSVTSIGSSAFSGCAGLTIISVNENNPVYDSRNDCNAIIETATDTLLYGSFNTVIPDSVICIGDSAFSNRTSLTSINIPSSVTCINSGAFFKCTKLKSINIPDSVLNIGSEAFRDCIDLTSITIPGSVTSIGNKALGYYYDNDYKKVSNFTIMGIKGSEAERYANENGFIFESEYCMVSGISNYCQAVAARKIEVGDTVAVTFKAPEDRDIVDVQWGLNYDKDMLELTGINSFDNEIMLVNSNAESYDVIGSYSNISTPAGVAKGGELVTFNFTVKQSGETTVDLNVVDMTIRIYGEDQILVENGEIKNICTHKTTRTIPGYPATCTQAGLTDEIVCAECEKVLIKAEVIPAKGHTPVADQGKAATCTETGLTEGSHCSVCNEVLVEQIEIPALGHLPIIDAYLAPTCSHEGHTAGSHCARCGEVYVVSETIPKIPHTVVTDEAVAPSCGHTGLTEGSHCSACGEVIVAQEVIPALTHQYEIVPAVPATYTKEGSTDGVRCKLCGEWLIEPQVTPKKTIDFTFGDVNEDGKVNIRDVTAIQRFLAEYTDLAERQRGAADVNFDGVVDINDATHLQMYLAEFDVVLGKQTIA